MPDSEVGAAKRYLEYLRDMGDPVFRALRDAPPDDEPETPEEARKVAEAKRDIERGDVVSHAAVRDILGL